jgi:tetratricopeptide (TPR) repeat protein
MRATGVLLILAIAGVCRAAPADDIRLCNETAESNPEVAIRACTAAIGSGQLSGADLAGASLSRGIAHAAKAEYELAIRDFDQAIRSKPDFAEAFANRCRAYIHKREDARALPDCEEAIRLDPNPARPLCSRARIRFDSGDYDGAMLDYDQAIRLDPGLAVGYVGRAALRLRRGQYDQAILDYGQALSLKPNSDAYYGRGWCYLEKRDYDSALQDFNESIRLKPNFADSYSMRAYVHILRREYYQAINDYGSALRVRPDAQDYYYRSWTFYQTGDYVSAFQDLVEASWLRPSILAQWIWIPLVPGLLLIYIVFRPRKAKEVEINGTDDAANEEWTQTGMNVDIETPLLTSGEDQQEMVLVGTYSYSSPDVKLARALLESENILTYLADEHAIDGAWNPLEGLRLFVPAPFLAQARALLRARISSKDLTAEAEASRGEEGPLM